MNNNWKLVGVFGGQLVFSVFFFEYFSKNSFLRPAVETNTEYCIALMLIFAMFANFWILRLLFRKKNTMLVYLLFSAMEVIVTAFVEYILTIDVNLSIYPNELLISQGMPIKRRFFINLLLRNSGLLCFVALISDNLRLRVQLQDKEKQLFREKHQLEVQQIADKTTVLLNEDEICYIIQNQNYNTFVSFCGTKYSKRGTLNNIQDLLGEKNYVKISRSIIVRLKYIKSVNNNIIELFMADDVKDYHLTISTTYISTALPEIEDFLKKREQSQTKSDNSGTKPDKRFSMLPHKAQNIHHYIINHPNCKLNDIVTDTHIPKSTITRYLKQMQDEGFVEYVGNKRTGGYRVKS